MKLSTIKKTLENALPLLESITIEGGNTAQTFRVRNVLEFKKGLEILDSINIFSDLIEPLSGLAVINQTKDSIHTPINDGNVVQRAASELVQASKLLLASIGKVTGADDNNDVDSIFIKLPEANSLDELSKSIEVFNKILTMTILDGKIGGEIILKSVEPGSVWLKVYLRTTLAVSVVGSLAWSSAVVYKKIQEGKLIEQIVRSKDLQNTERENLVNASKVLTDFLIEAEAQHLYETYYENGEEIDHEQIERLKQSIKLFSEEISKGAEVNFARWDLQSRCLICGSVIRLTK